MSENAAAGQGEEAAEDIELWYPSVDRFLQEFLLPSWRHTSTARWCRKWYLHAEAASRLDALCRAYEALRVGDPTGMAVVVARLRGPHHGLADQTLRQVRGL